jgi:hypothetical protein
MLSSTSLFRSTEENSGDSLFLIIIVGLIDFLSLLNYNLAAKSRSMFFRVAPWAATKQTCQPFKVALWKWHP